MTPALPANLTPAQKVELVASRIMEGASSATAVKEIFGDRRGFHKAIANDPSLNAAYITAMDIRADLLAEEIVDIADHDPDSNRARNRIGARQWLAAKLKPRTYGERIEMTVQHSVSITDAMQAARARTLRVKDCDIEDAVIVDTPALSEGEPTDIFS